MHDGYRGDYGIEDTRQALVEAKRHGIHPFCITVDSEARDYLPHTHGAVNRALVEDVKKLPLRVSDTYRRLTIRSAPPAGLCVLLAAAPRRPG